MLAPWKESDDQPRQHIKKQRHHSADRGPYSQSYGFSSSLVWMWELDHTEGWAPKNWCFQTVLLEKTFKSPLDCKEIKPVNPKGNQPWIFIGRTDTKAEAPILWRPDSKSQLFGKDSNAGKDWGQEKRAIKDGRVGWHHWLNGHEFEHTLRNSKGPGSLACFSSWDHKELDTTEQLNNKNRMHYIVNLIIVPIISLLKLMMKKMFRIGSKRTTTHTCCWCSVMFNSFATQWSVALQAPLSIGLPRQEYWNGLPFPSPGDLPDPLTTLALVGRLFTTHLPGKPLMHTTGEL